MEAEEFSLGSGPKNRVTAGAGSDGSRDFLPPPVGRAADVLSELLVPEPLEYLALVVPLEVGDGSVDNMTILDLLEHSGVGVREEPVSAYIPRVYLEESRNGGGGPRDHRGEDSTRQDPPKEVVRAPPEDGEAIVVGAVGSAAPWFLTGRAEYMEV